MLNKFKKNLKLLCSANDKLLLACSGGRDSMVLAHLLIKSGYSFSIAHFNFCLRNDESNEDELFVRSFAEKNEITIYIEKNDAKEYAHQHNLSVEMAARELRYLWFNQLLQKYHYTKILTAHHADDSIETFFINLLRGTGIAGLKGIPVVNNNIVRPLLFASRQKINEYVLAENIQYRDDSSNAEDIYLRNQIRHSILPIFERIQPNFRYVMQANMKRLEDANNFIEDSFNGLKDKILIINNNLVKVDIAALKKEHPLLLFYILKEYNFSSCVIEQIQKSLDAEAGKAFFSESHRLIKDRHFIYIEKRKYKVQQFNYRIQKDVQGITNPIHLKIAISKEIVFSKEKNIATFDYDQLQFPLVLRKWIEGDSFHPFGMKGKKLVSDFFIDNKFSIIDKENAWLLCSGTNIIWVVGFRIDDRYKITNNTQTVYKIMLEI